MLSMLCLSPEMTDLKAALALVTSTFQRSGYETKSRLSQRSLLICCEVQRG